MSTITQMSGATTMLLYLAVGVLLVVACYAFVGFVGLFK